MAGMQLNIPQETMSELIGSAILTSIDQAARDALLQSAITYLIAPSESGPEYRRVTGPSPLEAAFRDALHVYCRGYVATWMETDVDFQAAITGKLGELFSGINAQLAEGGEFARDLSEWMVTYVLEKQRDRHGDRY
jgi:hypothetical protein